MSGSSLQRRLLWLVGGGLVTVWLILALWLHNAVQHQVGQVLDERLSASARMVASLVHASAGTMADDTTLRQAVRSGLACQVMNLKGEVLARSGGAPKGQLAGEQDGFATQYLQGEPWRVYTFTLDRVRVATAEPLEGRRTLLRELALALLLGLMVALPVLLLAVGWAVQRALKPLESLRSQLQERPVTSTEPVALPVTLSELSPLVTTLNDWLDRAEQALKREQRLTDDLAHELRTPLAAMKTQLQVARLKTPADGDALAAAEQACGRMATNLEQLLALARVDEITDTVPTNARQIIEQAARAAMDSHCHEAVNWHLEGDLEATIAQPALAEMALRNLLENALRFSPAGSTLQIRVQQQAGLSIIVSDQGPGVAGDPATLVARGQRGDRGQSGLGLAIVATLMARSRGRLILANRPEGGLDATLYWPEG